MGIVIRMATPSSLRLLYRSRSALTRNMSDHAHTGKHTDKCATYPALFRPPTMAEYPVPVIPYAEGAAKLNAKYNSHLVFGVVFFLSTLAFGEYTGLLMFKRLMGPDFSKFDYNATPGKQWDEEEE